MNCGQEEFDHVFIEDFHVNNFLWFPLTSLKVNITNVEQTNKTLN